MILVDTHVLLWWVSNPEKLSKIALGVIEESVNSTIYVSAISVWEIYLLVNKGRLQLAIDIDRFIERIESMPFIHFIPIDNRIAAKSVMLPGDFHRDPADRMIVASAREKGVPLITGDERIRKYSHVQTVW
jgi:PIN domain nuclease of toxin-antitoxin system